MYSFIIIDIYYQPNIYRYTILPTDCATRVRVRKITSFSHAQSRLCLLNKSLKPQELFSSMDNCTRKQFRNLNGFKLKVHKHFYRLLLPITFL